MSFDRPFLREDGAALFFRLDFPLIVWLEDHGYTPGYVADLDLHRYPTLATGAKTLVFSGHGEYWTRRDARPRGSRGRRRHEPGLHGREPGVLAGSP